MIHTGKFPPAGRGPNAIRHPPLADRPCFPPRLPSPRPHPVHEIPLSTPGLSLLIEARFPARTSTRRPRSRRRVSLFHPLAPFRRGNLRWPTRALLPLPAFLRCNGPLSRSGRGTFARCSWRGGRGGAFLRLLGDATSVFSRPAERRPDLSISAEV